MRYLIGIICVVILSGCVATGNSYVKTANPGESEARLYIYRPSYFMRSGSYPSLLVDSTSIGALKNGGYITVVVPSGSHTITIPQSALHWGNATRTIPLLLKGGSTYYYKLDPSMSGDGSRVVHRYQFGPIDEAIAVAELKSLNESN